MHTYIETERHAHGVAMYAGVSHRVTRNIVATLHGGVMHETMWGVNNHVMLALHHGE